MTNQHWLLCRAMNFAAAQEQALGFFTRSLLIHYDRLVVAEKKALTGNHPRFWPQLEESMAANRRLLEGLIAELKAEGCRDFTDLIALGQGYQSKLLHLAAHLLDGFIGIDTVFYNLREDSHWLSDQVRAEVQAAPGDHWLLLVEAGFVSPERVALVHRLSKAD